MIKNRLVKKHQIFKGISFAFAGMLALTMIPTNVFTSAAEMIEGGIGSQSIHVVNAKATANKGSTYEIRAAYFGSDAKIPVGLDDSYYASTYLSSHSELKYGTDTITSITSNITVTYKPTGEVFEVAKEEGESKLKKTGQDATIVSGVEGAGAVWGTMQMDYAGEYGINYSITITHNGTSDTFSTEYIVTSSITSAYFEFNKNDSLDEVVLPSYYDPDMAKDLDDKNIYLPLPNLKDRDEKDVDYSQNIGVNGDKTDLTDKEFYVDVSVTGANSKPVTITKEGTKLFINSDYVDPENALYAGEGVYTIKYSYYVGKDNPQFVTSITKTFSVEQKHYTDYALLLTLDSTWPSSAITNVETTLPTLSATTSANTTPSRESVAIKYEIEARRQTDTGYDDVKKITDGKFKPWADGYYRIVYTAKDFYGKEETLTREINNVRDTQRPVAQVYDAADKQNYVENSFEKELVEEVKDASSLLKTRTDQQNIIIYAITGTDNVKEGLVLSRSIRNSSTKIQVDSTTDMTKNYAKYNLIFDYDPNTFVADNYAVKKMMDTENFEESKRTNADELKTWLKAHNYLIVVGSNDTSVEDKTVENGYAVIDLNLSGQYMLSGSAGGITYSVYYTVTDKAGNENLQQSYDMVVLSGDYTDPDKPVITFPTQLKSSYRKGSVIVFDAPTAADDDSRMDVITQYYYVKSNGDAYETRTFEDGEYRIDLSEIDEYLATEQELPTKVVITVYVEDDYGNKAEPWKKEISIIDVQDKEAPVIYTEKFNTPNGEAINQNEQIVLPTITLLDDHVDYINALVYVNRLDAEGKATPLTVSGKVETRNVRQKMYTLQAGSVIASYPGDYEVKVVFTDAGDNQVTTFYHFKVEGSPVIEEPVITGLSDVLGDAGKAEVGQAVELGVPSVDYAIDDGYDIFGVNTTDDSSRTAYDYDITFAKPPESEYRFNENEENTFTSLQPDIYKFQYNVRVSIFDKTKYEILEEGGIQKAVVEKTEGNKHNIIVQEKEDEETGNEGNIFIYTDPASSESNITVKYGIRSGDKINVYTLSSKITFKKDEALKQLYITKENNGEGTRYYLQIGEAITFMTRDGKETASFTLDTTSKKVTLHFSGSEQKEYESLDEPTTIDGKEFKTYYLTSNVITLTTTDTTAPKFLTEYDYPTTMEKGQTLLVKRIEASDNSIDGINKNRSYIRVTHVDGSGTDFSEYKLSEHPGDIEYKLNSDGRYTIAYYVYDNYNNLNSDLSYSIAVGDCQEPTVIIPKDMFKDKYELNETLDIDIQNIDFKDNDTDSDREYLLSTLKVVLKNTSNNDEEVQNSGDSENNIYSFKLSAPGTYKLEFTVRDIAGWEKTATVTFEVSTEADEGTAVYQTIGIILIVVAVVVLVGVIAYFVISKIRRDRKAKGKANDKTKEKAKPKKK